MSRVPAACKQGSRRSPLFTANLSGILACLLGSLSLSLAAFAQTAPPQGDAGRVRQAMLATYVHGITGEVVEGTLQPADAPHLRRLLADESFPRRDNVVAFMAFLGGPDETLALRRFLVAPPGRVNVPEEDRALLLTPPALGEIARRSRDSRALETLLLLTSGQDGREFLAPLTSRAEAAPSLGHDLVEAALRGLGVSGHPEALQRLQAIAGGQMPGVSGGRSLAGPAQRALELFHSPAASPSGQAGEPATSGEAAGGDVGSGHSDTTADAHQLTLSYANHVDLANPMTDVRLDEALAQGSLRAGRGDFADDVACCLRVQRQGTGTTFGTSGDGLDIIDDQNELYTVLGDSSARFKVIRAINYCGGSALNIIGCAWASGNGAAVVRRSSVGSEAGLWMHEFGHNTGLYHNDTSSAYFMYPIIYSSNNGMTQQECTRFHAPATGAAIPVQTLGQCTDLDVDMVADIVDNCPSTANATQSDTDGDGVGDACDSGTAACGDGVRTSGEDCDGFDLGGATCASLGWDGGSLACAADCTFDESGCTASTCGDGVVDSGEECDGSDLGGQSCAGRGWSGGTLACSSDCRLDESGCTDSICGNDTREGTEECDGADLNSESCISRGWDGGTLVCGSGCTLDESYCYCLDDDGDGVALCAGDCNDADASVYPGATEICNDGIDQDCNGRDKTKGCKSGGKKGGGGGDDTGPAEKCRNGSDDDGDGLADCADPDCASKGFCR